MDLALIGLGRMGTPMARNLLAAGHALHVHDIDKVAGDSLISAGAIWADSPAELAGRVEVVVSSVPGPADASHPS